MNFCCSSTGKRSFKHISIHFAHLSSRDMRFRRGYEYQRMSFEYQITSIVAKKNCDPRSVTELVRVMNKRLFCRVKRHFLSHKQNSAAQNVRLVCSPLEYGFEPAVSPRPTEFASRISIRRIGLHGDDAILSTLCLNQRYETGHYHTSRSSERR
jgi:hypothetical protein